MEKTNKILRIVICLFIFICIIQAMYYPIIIKPGATVEWWQVQFLAGLGYYLGAPIFMLSEYLEVQSNNMELFAWVTLIIWVSFIYAVLSLACDYLLKLLQIKAPNQSLHMDAAKRRP